MTYRDDRDADRARIAALEVELAQAQRRIAELEHRQSTALVHAGGNALAIAGGAKGFWYGSPLRLELTRRFKGEFPRDQLEDLIQLVRSVSLPETGHAELLKSSMTWSAGNRRDAGPLATVNVTVGDGITDLVVTDTLNQLAGAVYGGFGGGVGGGGLVIPILATMTTPVLIPIAVLGWLGGVFFGARAIYRRAARRRAEKLQELFMALSMEIEKRIDDR